ncbi:Uncharacterised protein [Mycobacteroides abscessus subsp. abscessus]|nr:Uncharacterised protein [Mycobacteroides abscessus subsp. abscessus]
MLRTSSTAQNRPRPRISPTLGCACTQRSSSGRTTRSPRSRTRFRIWSSSKTLMVSTPTAQANGWPE